MKKTRVSRRNVARSVLAVSISTIWVSGFAATFNVTKTADTNDGTCSAADCSLREAIGAANNSAGADTIEFNLTGTQTYKLTRIGADEDANDRGDLDITGNLTINGKGRTATIVDGNYTDRVFHVMPGKTVTLSKLKITRGKLTSTNLKWDGAGLLNEGTTTISSVLFDRNQVIGTLNNGGFGGAIHSRGPDDPNTRLPTNATLTVTGSKFVNNCSDSGGAVESYGTLTVVNTIFEGNKPVTDANGVTICRNGDAAAVHIQYGANASIDRSTFVGNVGTVGALTLVHGTVTINNSTFTGNQGIGGAYSSTGPGAVANQFSYPGTNITVKNSTIANNAALQYGGGTSGRVTLQNSIVANNTAGIGGADCTGTPVSEGNNIFGTTAGCSVAVLASDYVGSAGLGTATKDSTTQQTYVPLLAGSRAIDKANGSACKTYDQLNKSRPVDGDANGVAVCDIGAWEKR